MKNAHVVVGFGIRMDSCPPDILSRIGCLDLAVATGTACVGLLFLGLLLLLALLALMAGCIREVLKASSAEEVRNALGRYCAYGPAVFCCSLIVFVLAWGSTQWTLFPPEFLLCAWTVMLCSGICALACAPAVLAPAVFLRSESIASVTRAGSDIQTRTLHEGMGPTPGVPVAVERHAPEAAEEQRPAPTEVEQDPQAAESHPEKSVECHARLPWPEEQRSAPTEAEQSPPALGERHAEEEAEEQRRIDALERRWRMETEAVIRLKRERQEDAQPTTDAADPSLCEATPKAAREGEAKQVVETTLLFGEVNHADAVPKHKKCGFCGAIYPPSVPRCPWCRRVDGQSTEVS